MAQRQRAFQRTLGSFRYHRTPCRGGGMVDAVVSNTIDLKSRAGSSPAPGTKDITVITPARLSRQMD